MFSPATIMVFRVDDCWGRGSRGAGIRGIAVAVAVTIALAVAGGVVVS